MIPVSALATSHMEGLSSNYIHVPTMDIVEALGQEGWAVSHGHESRTRIEARKGFQKHILRFRQVENPIEVAGSVVELVLGNSHDGAGSVFIGGGFYRIICCNGLVVSDGEFQWFRHSHLGSLGEIMDGAMKVAANMTRMVPLVEKMRAKELSDDQRLELASRAVELRFGRPALDARTALLPRRTEDDRGDLWSTYNVLQENLVRGGMMGISRSAKPRKISAIRGAESDLRLNAGLWSLAESYVA